MMNYLSVLFVCVVLSSVAFGRYIRDYYDSDDEDYEADTEEITCSAPESLNNVFFDNGLHKKLLVVLKISPAVDLTQLLMFEELHNRFYANNFTNLQFLFVTPSNLSKYFFKSDYEALLTNFASLTHLVRVGEDVFNEFGFEFYLDDHNVYLIDNCQRLNFIIVHPWSSIEYPYVKAAILSTIYDAPCGYCNNNDVVEAFDNEDEIDELNTTNTEHYSTETSTSSWYNFIVSDFSLTTEKPTSPSDYNIQISTRDLDNSTTNNETTTTEPITETTEDGDDIEDISNLLNSTLLDMMQLERDQNFIIPIKIIIPSLHMHYDKENDKYLLYDNVVFKTDDSEYHKHVPQNPVAILNEIKSEDILNTQNSTANHTLTTIFKKAKSNKIYMNLYGNLVFKVLKTYEVSRITEMDYVDNDVEKTSAVLDVKRDVKKHYELLKKWLGWKFQ